MAYQVSSNCHKTVSVMSNCFVSLITKWNKDCVYLMLIMKQLLLTIYNLIYELNYLQIEMKFYNLF